MSSVKATRDAGIRRTRHSGAVPAKHKVPPSLGIDTGFGNTQYVNGQQMTSLENMYYSHPAVQAARSILHGQLLSGGIVLVRDGSVMKTVRFGQTDSHGNRMHGITEDLAQHLQQHWLPFAREAIDAFLKWGLCPVVFDVVQEDRTLAEAVADMKTNVHVADSSTSGINDITRRRQHIRATQGLQFPGSVHTTQSAPVFAPHVPHSDTYTVGWRNDGRNGYRRRYFIENNAAGHATCEDAAAFVAIRHHPDPTGNVNGPLASVYEIGTFVQSIVELAFTAEITRCHPSIVTQMAKHDKSNDLTSASLFYDSESRALNDEQENSESVAAARALEAQRTFARLINDFNIRGSLGGSTARNGTSAMFHPPDIPPKLFTLPKDQEMAPHAQVPQPRGDLEALVRLQIDQFCGALGVPASLLFEGKYAGKSTQQLHLLNSTVSELAKAVNDVLTKSYNLLYPPESGGKSVVSAGSVQLRLVTAPLAASQELVSLFTSGLVDHESALPCALHALGLTPTEIEDAKQRMLNRQNEMKQASSTTMAVTEEHRHKSDDDTKNNGEKETNKGADSSSGGEGQNSSTTTTTTSNGTKNADDESNEKEKRKDKNNDQYEDDDDAKGGKKQKK